MVYIIRVRKPGKTDSELVDVVAPDFATASMMLAANWPYIELIKLEGSYVEGMKGTA